MRSRLSLATVGAGVLLASAATAQPREAVRFDYRVHAGCPDWEAFRGQLTRRTDRFRLADPDEDAREFEIVVRSEGSGSRGVITIGGGSPRPIRAADCDEVVEALALMSALAIDPKAKTSELVEGPAEPPPADPPADPPTEPPAEPEPTEPAPIEPAPPEPAPPEPAPTEPAPTEPATAVPPADPVPEAVPVPPDDTDAAWRFGVGGHGFASFGLAPGVGGGGGLFVRVVAPGEYLAPALRLGFERSAPHTVEGQLASATFTWTASQLHVCPLKIGDQLRLRPCVSLHIGALQAADSTGSEPQDATRLWLATALSARGELALIEQWVWLELDVALVVPLTRDEFVLVPTSAIYQPAVVAGRLAAGLGVQFP